MELPRRHRSGDGNQRSHHGYLKQPPAHRHPAKLSVVRIRARAARGPPALLRNLSHVYKSPTALLRNLSPVYLKRAKPRNFKKNFKTRVHMVFIYIRLHGHGNQAPPETHRRDDSLLTCGARPSTALTSGSAMICLCGLVCGAEAEPERLHTRVCGVSGPATVTGTGPKSRTEKNSDSNQPMPRHVPRPHVHGHGRTHGRRRRKRDPRCR